MIQVDVEVEVTVEVEKKTWPSCFESGGKVYFLKHQNYADLETSQKIL